MKSPPALLLGKQGPKASIKRGSLPTDREKSAKDIRPSLSLSILRSVISIRSCKYRVISRYIIMIYLDPILPVFLRCGALHHAVLHHGQHLFLAYEAVVIEVVNFKAVLNLFIRISWNSCIICKDATLVSIAGIISLQSIYFSSTTNFLHKK